jgi:hypothetical protein
MGFWSDFGKGIVNSASGILNIAGGAVGLPEIPLLNPNDPSYFGHRHQEQAQQQAQQQQQQEQERTTALTRIQGIHTSSLTIPDIKVSGANQNFAMPPVFVPKGNFVDKDELAKYQAQAVLEQEILLGAIGIGGLAVLFFLKSM